VASETKAGLASNKGVELTASSGVCLHFVGKWSTEYPVESQGNWTFLQEGTPWTTTAS
jgi:hypothetical protein